MKWFGVILKKNFICQQPEVQRSIVERLKKMLEVVGPPN